MTCSSAYIELFIQGRCPGRKCPEGILQIPMPMKKIWHMNLIFGIRTIPA